MTLQANDSQIDFQPVGKRVTVAKYTTLLEAAIQAGIDLASACGGMGLCGQCRVRLLA
ncbi:MAG: 2Fe-2S iron-sulfur cluster binding domain-containing protein, partial [Anaerolineae bacterium]|nr:2Fe-2S iron-sulfur cluster binding domain-containing protein [Anaerolineae bacterium]